MKLREIAVPAFLMGSICVLFSAQAPGQDHEALRAPFTIERIDRSFGNSTVVEMRVVEAARSDGSTVRAIQYRNADGTPGEVREIVDLQRGLRTVVAPATQSITTYHFTEAQLSELRGRDEPCLVGTATDRILDYDVTAMTIDIPAMPGVVRRVVQWQAPALGCVELGSEVTTILDDGSERMTKTSEALRIVTGEPDAALFAIPSDYTESSPTEFAASVGEGGNPIVAPFDDAYRQNRAQHDR